jgi:hypothetical protein
MTGHAREQDAEGEGADEDDGGVVPGESPRVGGPPSCHGLAGRRRQRRAADLSFRRHLRAPFLFMGIFIAEPLCAVAIISK